MYLAFTFPRRYGRIGSPFSSTSFYLAFFPLASLKSRYASFFVVERLRKALFRFLGLILSVLLLALGPAYVAITASAGAALPEPALTDPSFIPLALASTFVAACKEELFFRGLMRDAFIAAGTPPIARTAATALLFGTAHLGAGVGPALYALAAGIAIGAYREWRGSIKECAAAHFAHNAANILFGFFA